MNFMLSWQAWPSVSLVLCANSSFPLEHKFHILSQPCNILYVVFNTECKYGGLLLSPGRLASSVRNVNSLWVRRAFLFVEERLRDEPRLLRQFWRCHRTSWHRHREKTWWMACSRRQLDTSTLTSFGRGFKFNIFQTFQSSIWHLVCNERMLLFYSRFKLLAHSRSEERGIRKNSGILTIL